MNLVDGRWMYHVTIIIIVIIIIIIIIVSQLNRVFFSFSPPPHLLHQIASNKITKLDPKQNLKNSNYLQHKHHTYTSNILGIYCKIIIFIIFYKKICVVGIQFNVNKILIFSCLKDFFI
jgi:hypothetical protein